jgi:hypothetical protein
MVTTAHSFVPFSALAEGIQKFANYLGGSAAWGAPS